MSAVEPLTPKQEALFREGLRTAPSLDPADTLPRSLLEYTTAEWADRCRRIFATLDACRAAPALPAGLPDVERLAAALRDVLDEFDYWASAPRPAIDGGTVRLHKFGEVQPEMERKLAAARAALEGSATLPSDR